MKQGVCRQICSLATLKGVVKNPLGAPALKVLTSRQSCLPAKIQRSTLLDGSGFMPAHGVCFEAHALAVACHT